METLSKKENAWSIAIGIAIGCIMGSMLMMSILEETEKCEGLKRENQMLQEMIMQYQAR